MKELTNKHSVGQTIAKLRKQKGWTQEDFAQRLYVSRTAVSKWESGRGYPNIESLKAIAKEFLLASNFLAKRLDELYWECNNRDSDPPYVFEF